MNMLAPGLGANIQEEAVAGVSLCPVHAVTIQFMNETGVSERLVSIFST